MSYEDGLRKGFNTASSIINKKISSLFSELNFEETFPESQSTSSERFNLHNQFNPNPFNSRGQSAIDKISVANSDPFNSRDQSAGKKTFGRSIILGGRKSRKYKSKKN